MVELRLWVFLGMGTPKNALTLLHWTGSDTVGIDVTELKLSK